MTQKVRLERKQPKMSVSEFLLKEYNFTITMIGLLIIAMILFLAICMLLVPCTNGFYVW